MEAIIEFHREDREPQGNYHYGAEIDSLLDELVGAPDGILRDESLPDPPPIPFGGSDARLQLHESGPEIIAGIQTAIGIVGTITSLFGAWLAWKQHERDAPERTVTITLGSHRYEGRPSPELAKHILDGFAKFAESDGQPKRPPTS